METDRIKPRWVRIWLACLAFYFPVWWLGQFSLFALPSLAATLLLGYRLRIVDVSLHRVFVWSTPPDFAAHPQDFRSLQPHHLWVVVLVVTLLAAVLIRRLHAGARVLVGLGAAVWAEEAQAAILRPGPFGQLHFTAILHDILLLAVLGLGFTWMLSGWCLPRYGARVASLLAAAGLPAAIGVFIFRRGFFGPPRYWDFLPLAAMFLAALVASVLRSPCCAEAWNASSRPAILGGIITALLAVALHWGGPQLHQAFRRHQLAANRAALAAYPPNPIEAPYPKIFFQKGVNFSAEFPDPYASAGARHMLKALRSDGVNAVALVPYGWTRIGSVRIGSFGRHSWESDEGIREMARVAHALGMKVMLKPGMWVRGGRYAGSLKFTSQAREEAWFVAYQKFIDHYARLATEVHADIFCVGGEFVHLSTDTAAWRHVIARVRKLYPGPLTYAANFGGEFGHIKFWDALDYLGLQEYYPLPANLSTASVVAQVEAVEDKFHKPVIFTEVGFPSRPGANQKPWNDSGRATVDLALQARCYEAIFRAFYRQPWFEGMYWWKVGTNGEGGPHDSSLTPWGKPAMAVMKKWYESSFR